MRKVAVRNIMLPLRRNIKTPWRSTYWILLDFLKKRQPDILNYNQRAFELQFGKTTAKKHEQATPKKNFRKQIKAIFSRFKQFCL